VHQSALPQCLAARHMLWVGTDCIRRLYGLVVGYFYFTVVGLRGVNLIRFDERICYVCAYAKSRRPVVRRGDEVWFEVRLWECAHASAVTETPENNRKHTCVFYYHIGGSVTSDPRAAMDWCRPPGFLLAMTIAMTQLVHKAPLNGTDCDR
jgi:hypothetical protein